VIPFIRLQDIVDIIIITILVYQLFRWFRNTRALQVVIGLAFLGVLYIVTRALGLFMTSWILQELGTVLFVLIIVVFQGEIRQALYRVSLLRHAIGRQGTESRLDLRDFAETAFALAGARTGALIVFQRRESIDDYLLHGVEMDALVSSHLLKTIFQNGTPLHDGAVVIKGERLMRASCHLPLAVQSELPEKCGTRHRAALGVSERSDAVVVVISEERGTVSLAIGQELVPVNSIDSLQEQLAGLLVQQAEVTSTKLKQGVLKDFGVKAIILFLVLASWLVLTTKQGEIITVTAPVRMRNLPEHLTLQKSLPEEVDVQLKVFSSLIPSPKQLDVVAEIDLAKVHEGTNQLSMRNEDFKLPIGVKISQIKPSFIKIIVAKKVKKQLPVRITTTGSLPGRYKLKRVKVEPSILLVEGPEQIVANLNHLEVEEIDLSHIQQTVSLDRAVLSPAPQVKIAHDGAVKVKVVVGN